MGDKRGDALRQSVDGRARCLFRQRLPRIGGIGAGVCFRRPDFDQACLAKPLRDVVYRAALSSDAPRARGIGEDAVDGIENRGGAAE